MSFKFITASNSTEQLTLIQEEIENSGISYSVENGVLTLQLDSHFDDCVSQYESGLFNKDLSKFDGIFNNLLELVFKEYATKMIAIADKIGDTSLPTFDDYGLEHIGLYFEEKLVEVAQLSEQVA